MMAVFRGVEEFFLQFKSVPNVIREVTVEWDIEA
jgi:hypothetical protein